MKFAVSVNDVLTNWYWVHVQGSGVEVTEGVIDTVGVFVGVTVGVVVTVGVCVIVTVGVGVGVPHDTEHDAPQLLNPLNE